jgi:hypothetical protein
MFCARCGEQIPDASQTCQICRQEATLKLDPVLSPAPTEPYPPYAFVTIPQNLGPKGVGGWLWIFCVNASVLAPAFALARWSERGFQNPVYALEQIRLLYGAVVGVFLWMQLPIALVLLRIYFIFVAAEFVLLWLRLVSVALARHVSLFELTGFSPTLWALGLALAWFLYFRKSQRVRNTYGTNI